MKITQSLVLSLIVLALLGSCSHQPKGQYYFSEMHDEGTIVIFDFDESSFTAYYTRVYYFPDEDFLIKGDLTLLPDNMLKLEPKTLRFSRVGGDLSREEALLMFNEHASRPDEWVDRFFNPDVKSYSFDKKSKTLSLDIRSSKPDLYSLIPQSGEEKESPEGLIERYIYEDEIGVYSLGGFETLMVTDGGLRIRERPNSGSPILATLDKGTILSSAHYKSHYIDEGNYFAPWIQVFLPDAPEKKGWVYGAFVGPMLDRDPSENIVKSEFKNLENLNPDSMEQVYSNFRHWGPDAPIQVPEGNKPAILYDRGHQVIVIKNVSLHPDLKSLYVTAVDPMGRLFEANISPDIIEYDKNGKLDTPAFSFGFNVFDAFKPGVWEFTISQTVMPFSDMEPVSFSLEIDKRFIATASLTRSPFDMSAIEPYQPGDSLFIFATHDGELGIYYDHGLSSSGESYPIAGAFLPEDSHSDSTTVELVLGNDIPTGHYVVAVNREEYESPIVQGAFDFVHEQWLE